MDIISNMDTKKEKISRFASGKFSFNDYLSVNSFFQKEEHNNDLEKIMEDEWAATQNAGDDKERLSKILNRLHLHINQNTGKQAHPFEFYRLFSKLAAVLLIPALITIAVLSYIKRRL